MVEKRWEVKKLLVGLLVVLCLGCAAGINYLMVSPQISEYSPGGLVILPTRAKSEGMDAYVSLINSRLTETMEKTGVFKRVVSPDRVITAMDNNEKIMDAVTKIFSRYQAIGRIDKRSIKTITGHFGVSQVIFVRLTDWNIDIVRTTRYTTVGISLLMVDKSGEILWKAQHTIERRGSVIFSKERTQTKKTTDDVINAIMKTFPFKKTI